MLHDVVEAERQRGCLNLLPGESSKALPFGQLDFGDIQVCGFQKSKFGPVADLRDGEARESFQIQIDFFLHLTNNAVFGCFTVFDMPSKSQWFGYRMDSVSSLSRRRT